MVKMLTAILGRRQFVFTLTITHSKDKEDSDHHDKDKADKSDKDRIDRRERTAAPLAQHHSPEVLREAERRVEAERARRETMPYYPGLERYQLLEKMGDGAFSVVYKALDTQTNTPVALKIVRKYEKVAEHSATGQKRSRVTERANILKEVNIMRTISHEGIVALLDFQESTEYYYLVLELLPGGELFHQIVALTYFSEDLARHVILQVAKGIQYLHKERGVVHRDIKPENLLFERIPIIPSHHPQARQYDEDKVDEGQFVPGLGGGGIGKVKIADFGLSKVVWNEDTMTPCGTVGYTAPEIVKDERYSTSVDMWALGCVLYTLLCGFPPFFDESVHVLTEKVARGYYTFLSPWWDDISDSSKDLISHLLCVDPEQRYTIDQFLAHPWCQQKSPRVQKPARSSLLSVPADSPMLDLMRRRNFASPGLNQLKEAFDVTYAVHRQEEEAQRRSKLSPNAGLRSRLAGLNEEDENRPVEKKRVEPKEVKKEKEPVHYQGYGGVTDRRAAEAELYGGGRAGSRDRGRKAFELNIDGATLLGRRKAHTPSALAQSPITSAH